MPRLAVSSCRNRIDSDLRIDRTRAIAPEVAPSCPETIRSILAMIVSCDFRLLIVENHAMLSAKCGDDLEQIPELVLAKV